MLGLGKELLSLFNISLETSRSGPLILFINQWSYEFLVIIWSHSRWPAHLRLEMNAWNVNCNLFGFKTWLGAPRVHILGWGSRSICSVRLWCGGTPSADDRMVRLLLSAKTHTIVPLPLSLIYILSSFSFHEDPGLATVLWDPQSDSYVTVEKSEHCGNDFLHWK